MSKKGLPFHIVAQMMYNDFIVRRYNVMSKNISISIRVSEEELTKLKRAARLEAYASYSEFIRRTALIEANKIIKNEAAENRQTEEGETNESFNKI